jgi:hypothetical protein
MSDAQLLPLYPLWIGPVVPHHVTAPTRVALTEA